MNRSASLALLPHGARLLLTFGRAVAVDLSDQVAYGHRDVGIDDARLRDRAAGTGRVASLEVFPTSPTLAAQMLTGTLALMAPFCVVDAETGHS